jgi:chloride channel protein, CIC family
VAHAFTVLTLKRSILTEKVARRGYHLSREYAVDPLELLYAREVMDETVRALPSDTPLGELVNSPQWREWERQEVLPVIDGDGCLTGLVTTAQLEIWIAESQDGCLAKTLGDLAPSDGGRAYSDEILRILVYRMAEKGLTRLPVVERENGRLAGLVTLEALLKARSRHWEEERRRERVLKWRYFTGQRTETLDAES